MPLKVYYLDDELALYENFADYFASDDAEVVTFTKPEQALEAIRQNPPDLLFVDFRMPGTRGDKFAQSLAPNFPVFLITGDVSVQTDFAFQRVFAKPVDVAEISAVLATHVARHKVA